MDICKTCNIVMATENLMKDSAAVKGYRNKCLDCVSKSRGNSTRIPRGRYEPNRVETRKSFLDEARNVPCLDCNRIFPPCAMDFDHIGEKSFGIMQQYRSRSIQELAAEIAKCEVVCAVCHRIRTYNRRNE
jgi:hypothetical protein